MQKKNLSLSSKKMLRTINNKYGNISEYYAEKGRRNAGKPKASGFGSDKIGKDGLTGRERAVLAGKKGGRPRKGYTYGQAKY